MCQCFLQDPGSPQFKLLRAHCTLTEVLEGMQNPTTGLAFLARNSPLPSTTFVAAEAVLWLLDRVEGVTTEARATSMLERMVEQGLVRHASGDPRVRFIYGFYLYYVVQGDTVPVYQVQCSVLGTTAVY